MVQAKGGVFHSRPFSTGPALKVPFCRRTELGGRRNTPPGTADAAAFRARATPDIRCHLDPQYARHTASPAGTAATASCGPSARTSGKTTGHCTRPAAVS